ncbi:MAG: metallophosphoesterase [Clostridia bacterium]|nr:metallophosphoesterase [Clostridia bacterium]
MNRRPSQSRTEYDSFSPRHTNRFTAATPDARFFEPKRTSTLRRRIFYLACAVLLALCVVNLAVNQFVLVRRAEVPVRGLSQAFDGYAILHISDLKGSAFGSRQGLFRFALNKKHFDAVVMTGDMVSALGSAQPLYDMIDQLRDLNPDAPIYMIPGDSDPVPTSESYFSSGSPFAPWVLGARQRGAQLLSSPAAIEREGQTLWLTTGSLLSLDTQTMQRQFEQQYLRALSSGDDNAIELATFNLKWLDETRTARELRTDDDVCVTLAHTPPTPQDTWLSQTGLVLCGHYMGGLVRLPLIGPLFIPSASLPRYGVFPGAFTHFGLRRENKTWIYTSPGLGAASDDYPPLFFRLFNPPSVTLVTLTPSAL